LIQIGSKTAEKNSAQTNKQTDRHYENNGHLAVNQKWRTLQNIQKPPQKRYETLRQYISWPCTGVH